MKIQKLTPNSKHFRWVVEMIKERWGFPEKESIDEVQRWASEIDDSICFIGIVDDKPMAFGAFDVQSQIDISINAWNKQLWVNPKYNGNDYGHLLTQKRWEWARSKNYKKVYQSTKNPGYPSQYGWKIVREYIDSGGITRFIMEYTL